MSPRAGLAFCCLASLCAAGAAQGASVEGDGLPGCIEPQRLLAALAGVDAEARVAVEPTAERSVVVSVHRAGQLTGRRTLQVGEACDAAERTIVLWVRAWLALPSTGPGPAHPAPPPVRTESAENRAAPPPAQTPAPRGPPSPAPPAPPAPPSPEPAAPLARNDVPLVPAAAAATSPPESRPPDVLLPVAAPPELGAAERTAQAAEALAMGPASASPAGAAAWGPRLGVSLHALGAFDGALAPSGQLSLEAGLGMGPGLSLRGVVEGLRRAQASPGSVIARANSFSAAAQWRFSLGRLAIVPSLGGGVLVLTSSSAGYTSTLERSDVVGLAVAGLEVRWTLPGGVFASALAQGQLRQREEALVIQGLGEVMRIGSASGALGIGLGWAWR